VAFPSRLYERLAADDANLEALAALGSDAGEEHVVTHHFFAAAIETLQEIEDLGLELGLTTAGIQPMEGTADRPAGFRLNLQSRATLSPFHVYRESLLMSLIAEACAAEYDNWEARPGAIPG
jgi:hypothetical protein